MKQSSNFESLTSTHTGVIQSMSVKTTSLDLLQNCDLPPPLKVFPVLNPTANPYGLMGEDGDRAGLLTALQLSQTRAREAEKRIQGLAKEKDCLSDAVMRESLLGLAYRNWVRVLECQVSVLKRKVKKRQEEDERVVAVETTEEEVEVAGWAFSWAIPLGMAGIGFAFAFRFLF